MATSEGFFTDVDSLMTLGTCFMFLCYAYCSGCASLCGGASIHLHFHFKSDQTKLTLEDVDTPELVLSTLINKIEYLLCLSLNNLFLLIA